MHGSDFTNGLAATSRLAARRSLQARASRAGRAIGYLDDALVILRGLDDDIYWNVAATACDAADDLRGWLDRDADEDGLLGDVTIDDARLAPHRAAVTAGQRRRPVPSETASDIDLVDFTRQMVFPALKRDL